MSWHHQSGIGRNNLDFVRFVLAIAVILSHSYALLQGADHEPLFRPSHGQISAGALGVDWFFVISGFLIAHSWLRSKSTLDYFKKRILRIYPAFIVAVLLGVLVVSPIASASARGVYSEIKIPALIGNILRLQNYEIKGLFLSNPSHAVNGSLWSISYEFWCYVGVALMGLAGFLKRPRLVASIFLAAIVISIIFIAFHLTPGGKFLGVIFGYPPFWARLLPYYLAGTLFYLYRANIPFSNWLAGLAILLLVPAAILHYGMAIILPIAGTYLLFWFAFHPRIRLENWARFGDFSYGMYVFAFPIQQLLIMKLGSRIPPLYLFAWATPLSILAGAISWHLVERRFLKLKKKSLIEAVAPVSPAPVAS